MSKTYLEVMILKNNKMLKFTIKSIKLSARRSIKIFIECMERLVMVGGISCL
jgi:hypothetical protein